MDKQTHNEIVQALLCTLGQNVEIDGIVGSRTLAAISSLPERRKRAVAALSQSLDAPCSIFMCKHIDAEIRRAASLHPQIEKQLRVFLRLMARTENMVFQDISYIVWDGTFRGVAQFNAATWRLVAPQHPFSLTSSLQHSLDAAASLYIANYNSFQKAFPASEFTAQIAYLFHNQGAPSAVKYLKGSTLVYPHQSIAALDLFQPLKGAFYV